jgi:hypothetical protein
MRTFQMPVCPAEIRPTDLLLPIEHIVLIVTASAAGYQPVTAP